MLTLPEYLNLQQCVREAILRLEQASADGEDAESIEVLAGRLGNACTALSGASCKDAGLGEIREAERVVRDGRRLVFALRVAGKRQEFPKEYTGGET